MDKDVKKDVGFIKRKLEMIIRGIMKRKSFVEEYVDIILYFLLIFVFFIFFCFNYFFLEEDDKD